MTELLPVRLTPGRAQGIGAETLIARIHKNEPYFFWEFNRWYSR